MTNDDSCDRRAFSIARPVNGGIVSAKCKRKSDVLTDAQAIIVSDRLVMARPIYGTFGDLGGSRQAPDAIGLATGMPPAGVRNGAERKEWTATEDDMIRSSVAVDGCRWRKIAAMLPGRTDDAVRNRWSRLKLEDSAAAVREELPANDIARLQQIPAVTAASSSSRATGGLGSGDLSHIRKEGNEKSDRVSWSKVEDELILESVGKLGHKWNRIAERLPGRTHHAIRNRFHRLQILLSDHQRLQQHSLAPSVPLPIAEHGGLMSGGGFDTLVDEGGHPTPGTV